MPHSHHDKEAKRLVRIHERMGGTTMAGWTEEQVQHVWEKGTMIMGVDERSLRRDECGAWIVRMEYGNRQSIFGWEIDHINPGGGDVLSNLRPLQWKNNVAKSDGRLICVVTALGSRNVEM